MSGAPRPAPSRLAAARLAAVQALYQAELTGCDAATAIHDFLEHGVGRTVLLGPGEDGGAEVEVALPEPDADLFASIVTGALARRADLDAMIDGALSDGWTVAKLESVMRSILRAGAFELAERADIPPLVSIDEYVKVADAFYGGAEPGLVNAVLDRIAHARRAAELPGHARA